MKRFTDSLTIFNCRSRILFHNPITLNTLKSNLEKLPSFSAAQKWARGAVAAVGISAAAASSAGAAGVSWTDGFTYVDPEFGYKQLRFKCENSSREFTGTANRDGTGNSIDNRTRESLRGYTDVKAMANEFCREEYPDPAREVKAAEPEPAGKFEIVYLMDGGHFFAARDWVNKFIWKADSALGVYAVKRCKKIQLVFLLLQRL